MYQSAGKIRAAAQRSLEQRQREDGAQRLRDVVPNLTTLVFEISERSGVATIMHRKHVAIGTAPALFEIRCGDPRCEHGGHDITLEVLQSLRTRQLHSEGEHVCAGQTGSATCTRRIHYTLCARYGASQS